MKQDLFFLFIGFAAAAPLRAVEPTVYYEGRLLSASGSVRSNETVSMTFRYASGGVANNSSQSVKTDSSGYFGAVVPGGELSGSGTLTVTAGGTTIQPNQTVYAVPLAMVADKADTIALPAANTNNAYALEGTATIGTLTGKELSITGTCMVTGNLVLTGRVSGFSTVYAKALNVSQATSVSFLYSPSEGSTGYNYDSATGDAELSATETSGFFSTDYNQTVSKDIIAEHDGFMTVWAYCTGGNDSGDSYYGRISITTPNFTVANGRQLGDSNSGKCHIFTFPVRKGEKVGVNLKNHRATTVYGVKSYAKIKYYYFGKN